MKNFKITIIGNSPGVCVCAIYLKTANIPLSFIRKDMKLKFGCSYVAGLPNTTADQFNENSFLQVKNMDIMYVDSWDIESMTLKNKKIVLKYVTSGTATDSDFTTDILVLDKNIYNLEKSENIFIIEEYAQNEECIEIASAGCKIAFAIKEILNN